MRDRIIKRSLENWIMFPILVQLTFSKVIEQDEC